MSREARLTALCHGGMVTIAFGLNLLPVFLPRLSAEFGGAKGLTGEQLGRLGALAFLGLVAGIAVTGPLADRLGAKVFAVGGSLLTAVGLAAMALSPTYAAFGAASFLMGLAAGMLDMVLSPVVAALHPERRSAAINRLHSFYALGAVGTILLGVGATGMGWSWRTASGLLVPISATLGVGFALLKFPVMAGEARTPFGVLLRDRWFRIAAVAIFLGGATELGLAQWLPTFAERTLGYPAWMGGASLAAFSLAMAAGRLAVGAMGTRLDPFRIMAWGCATSVGLFIAATTVPHPVWALGACVAVGFTGSTLWPTMLAVSADRYPSGGATMFGALAAMGNAGGIAMPWVVGAVADRSDLRVGLATSLVAPLLMWPLVLRLARRG